MMKIKNLKEKLIKFLNSPYYLISLGLLSFLIFILPTNSIAFFGIMYCLFAFLPLLYSDGRHYLPLILFSLIYSKGSIEIHNVEIINYFIFGSIIISMVIKIIIQKLSYRKGDLLIPMLILNSIFVLSFLLNIVALKKYSINLSGIYLLLAFLCLLLYTLL